jgi:hypothetical protein
VSALARGGTAGKACRLVPGAVQTQQGRSLRLLAQGQGTDVVWTVTTEARERDFLAVRIPIDRGLIRAQDRARFAGATSLAALAPLRAG